jgi:hypothetical protein
VLIDGTLNFIVMLMGRFALLQLLCFATCWCAVGVVGGGVEEIFTSSTKACFLRWLVSCLAAAIHAIKGQISSTALLGGLCVLALPLLCSLSSSCGLQVVPDEN